MSGYVVDASVAAKWFLPAKGETLVAESVGLLEEYAGGRVALLVPELFWAELGNILWKAVRAGRMTRESGEEAIGSLVERKIPTARTAALLRDAFAIAVAFDRTVYDALYVALAVEADKTLVTADERLANALGGHFPVRWLGAL